jgi:signal transduction histidine kinase
MAISYHQPSVNALFDAMPLSMLTFGVNGQVTYANKAAKVHPGRPVESMSGKPVIKSLATAINMGKVKLPYYVEVELADGARVKGQFMAGLSGLDIAFVFNAEAVDSASPHIDLGDIIALLRHEIGPPLHRLSNMLGSLPESPKGSKLEAAADELNERLRRLADLISVFGDEVLLTGDRIDIAALVKSVCDELTPRALTRRVHFVVNEPGQTLPPIYGNSKIIRRAFYECFDNAVTHSRREVSSKQDLAVNVTYMLTGEHVLISVRNLGAIPEEIKGVETRDLFTRTSALGPAESNGRLGLPLVQRIVGLHGGNMRMTAVGDDEVRVLMEFPTGAPQRGQTQLDIAQAQRYAADLAKLMSHRKKEAV